MVNKRKLRGRDPLFRWGIILSFVVSIFHIVNAFSLSLTWFLQAHILTQALCRGMSKVDCMRYSPVLSYLPELTNVCVCVCAAV